MCNRRRLDGIPFLLENIRRILKMSGRTISDTNVLRRVRRACASVDPLAADHLGRLASQMASPKCLVQP